MHMFDALLTRKSTRKFLPDKIEDDILTDILDFANELTILSHDITVEYELIDNTDKNHGYYSPFTIKTPYYICISSESKENHLINTGYLMQQINIYLATKGFGSCFLGTGLPKKVALPDMKYEYITALAFGKTSEEIFRDSNEAKRLPEKDIAVYKEEVPAQIKAMIGAARLSPSYLNSQPWRFVVYSNRIHVFCKKASVVNYNYKNTRMMDIGIAMANILLIAEEYWITTQITKLETISSKTFNKNDYVLTILIDSNE